MDNKLTLKLNENVIQRAKLYAIEKKISLSRLIENYLDAITKNGEVDDDISPFVKSIHSGKPLPKDFDEKKMRSAYLDYLDKKYK